MLCASAEEIQGHAVDERAWLRTHFFVGNSSCSHDTCMYMTARDSSSAGGASESACDKIATS